MTISIQEWLIFWWKWDKWTRQWRINSDELKDITSLLLLPCLVAKASKFKRFGTTQWLNVAQPWTRYKGDWLVSEQCLHLAGFSPVPNCECLCHQELLRQPYYLGLPTMSPLANNSIQQRSIWWRSNSWSQRHRRIDKHDLDTHHPQLSRVNV